MISSTKIIEHKIVVGNDTLGPQHPVVSRKVRIACERNVVTQTGRTPASSVHTVLSHGARNDEVRDRLLFGVLLEAWFRRKNRIPAF